MEDGDTDSYISGLNILLEQVFLGFGMDTLIGLIILMVLIFFSGLISGSETAFFSLSPSDIETLKLRSGKKDKAILSLLTKPKKLLATILISNNFINVSIVILSTYIVANIFDIGANAILIFILQVIVVTSVLLIFGEIIPKIMSNKEPVAVANLMVYNLKFLIWLFKPLSGLLVSSTSVIDKRFGRKNHNISMSDLSDAIEITSDRSVTEEEKLILKGIATFGEKEASEIMVSRVNVTAIDKSMSLEDVKETVLKSGFSRIPVFDETLDNIMGVMYIKDLLPYANNTNLAWIKLVRKPVFFVPENKRINDLLQEFRQKKIHLAIVVDEYGGTSGIITLEDIIEEIVGEISDEFDLEPLQFKYDKLSESRFVFEAKTPIVDFCKILHLDDEKFDEVKGESDSLGGLILELQGKIPEQGTTIDFENMRFEVIDADVRKINRIKIEIIDNKIEEDTNL
ncbi:MAG: hemolysin [Lentimicrobiaceae bacterium]|nr:hemolysin [Lentimicrobiaceae bacterium]MDG1901686.1 gliding motility-associated protein GldE [Bacteroidales bacterium]MDG2081784.1 gliding motility-associated protein GldE [Bacteroidales bacterium]